MQGEEQKFEAKLPARITGLVFWGLVLVGLLLAVIILQQAESDLVEESRRNTLVIAHQIEEVAEEFSEAPVIEKAFGRIRSKAIGLMDIYRFHAVRLYENNISVSIGEIKEGDDVYEYVLHYYPLDSTVVHEIKLELYDISAKKAISELRKKFLLSIGFGVFIFGFFLQHVLQKMLSSPFQKMVFTAEKFSKGNDDVRFDDKSADEFGYLGKFINNAIDSIMSSKNELVVALQRASASEVALGIEKERAEVTLYSITDSVITVDMNECIVYLNPAAEKLLNNTFNNVTENASGKKFNKVFKVVNENTGDEIENPIHRCFLTGEKVQLPEHSSLETNNSLLTSIEASIAPMKKDTGDLIGAVIVIQDVSHTRRLTKQLSYQASHDLLTGLYNRRKFEENLQEILINVREEDSQHALFYLDLDDFKIVNDTCGHVAGDELLKQLPALFNEVLRSGDIVARLGGDEFGIILQNCGLQQAENIADKIRQKIKSFRFIWNDRPFNIGASIGVVGINSDNTEISKVLSTADVACYAAKDAGRNRVHVYEPSDEAVSEHYGQVHWTTKISTAIEDKRFRLYMQPIVNVDNNKRDHFEVLLRMLDDGGSVIYPGAFIPAAERYGFIREIDRWVISNVFSYIGKNYTAESIKNTKLVIAINLSGNSINDASLLEFILHERMKYNISLTNVCFEITETIAINNYSKAVVFMRKLKSHGCQFALDDFGSGVSSFAYLKNLPVDYLKIDGSFVKDVSRDKIDRTMVESIQQIGKVMKLRTIAEHVEDEATLNVLKEIGVDYVQGYYLGRPEAIELNEAIVA